MGDEVDYSVQARTSLLHSYFWFLPIVSLRAKQLLQGAGGKHQSHIKGNTYVCSDLSVGRTEVMVYSSLGK